MSPFELCGKFEKIENGVYHGDRYQIQNCMVWLTKLTELKEWTHSAWQMYNV